MEVQADLYNRDNQFYLDLLAVEMCDVPRVRHAGCRKSVSLLTFSFKRVICHLHIHINARFTQAHVETFKQKHMCTLVLPDTQKTHTRTSIHHVN